MPTSTDQAQKGFRTFVLTLVISLVIFSVLYYLLSTSTKADINNDSKTTGMSADTKTVLAVATAPSLFEDLYKQKIDLPKKSVLAGATEATQTSSSVPATGSTEMTVGLMLSSGLLLFGFYVLYLGPRRLALKSFENRVTRDL